MADLPCLQHALRHLHQAVMLLLSIAIVFGYSSLAAAIVPSPIVPDASTEYPLTGHMEYVRDPSGKLSFRALLDSGEKVRFSPLHGYLSKGYTTDAFWIRFSVQRTRRFPELSMLRIWPAYLDSVTVCLQEGTDPAALAAYRSFQLGDHIPFTASPVKNPEIVVPLKLTADKPSMVYLRVKSGSAVNLTASIHTIDDLTIHTTRYIISRAAFLGITLVIMTVNLIVYFRIRDRVYLWLLLYTISIFQTIFSLSNLYGYFLPFFDPLILDNLAGLGLGGGAISFSLFARKLFSTSQYRWIDFYLWLMIAGGFLCMVTTPFGYYSLFARYLFIGFFGVIIIMTLLSLKAVRKKEPEGWLYLLAFGIANPGYVLQFLRLLGVIPVAWWNTEAFELASMINMLFIAFALTEEIHRREREKLKLAQTTEKRALSLADAMTHEISENRKELEIAQASLKNTIDRQHRFLRMMSHEYSTPLAIVVANLDYIELTGSELYEAHRQEIDSIHRAVDRLVELMDISLKQSRIAAPEDNFRFSVFPVAPFFSSLMTEVRSIWPKRVFICPASHDFTEMFGDPYYLNKLMLNLIDNACKYSPEGSSVGIDILKKDEHVLIEVVNQVRGLLDNDIGALFEEFQRGKANAGTSGAGIGLWLVKEITERHHGRIVFEKKVQRVHVSIFLPEKAYSP